MPDFTRTLIKPVVTEKSSAAYENAKIYTFRVHLDSSKPAIREAIEHLFGVTVTAVRTMTVRTKERKAGGMGRGRAGRRSSWKKAIVTLKEGDAIQIFEG
ncbi:MAG: 50S ribosomal protein L23 [Gemmatimonadota bacterium]|jgi:large subunit ribosomal protein L23|nr:50S ribosomal protein L23 [Gemmatimonadales bacterium]